MTSTFRLLAALLSVVFSTAFFGPSHRLMPAVVRHLSFGFIAVAVVFFLAGITRHVLVAGLDFQSFIVAHAIYFTLLLFIAGAKYPAELVLYLAASSGVDLVAAGAGVAGVDIRDSTLQLLTMAWEFTATFVAVFRLHGARRRATN